MDEKLMYELSNSLRDELMLKCISGFKLPKVFIDNNTILDSFMVKNIKYSDNWEIKDFILAPYVEYLEGFLILK